MDYEKMWNELKKSIEKSKNDFETSNNEKDTYEFVEFKMGEIEGNKDNSSINEKFNSFVTKFEKLIGEGRELVEELKSVGINMYANQMELYLLNKMQSFLNDNEIFSFIDTNNRILDIMEEEEECEKCKNKSFCDCDEDD